MKIWLLFALSLAAPIATKKVKRDCIPVASTSFDTEPAPCQEDPIIAKNHSSASPNIQVNDSTNTIPVSNSESESVTAKNSTDSQENPISTVDLISDTGSDNASSNSGIRSTAGSGNLGKL